MKFVRMSKKFQVNIFLIDVQFSVFRAQKTAGLKKNWISNEGKYWEIGTIINVHCMAKSDDDNFSKNFLECPGLCPQ